ncbi:Ig-like domain-containing protein [Variovorax sp. VaC1]|uniref:Ig-like domain-containing protein n=1 Tax=Variovorax sp. VaC1 TaxID=3373132 RepID=UPI003747999B
MRSVDSLLARARRLGAAMPFFALACAMLLLLSVCVPARAAMDEVGRATPSVHRLKFFVDPQLVADIGVPEAGRRLAQYVADINTVFTRETVRSFVFDPAKDLRVVAPGSAPQCGFNGVAEREVVLCVSKSQSGYSHGGLTTSTTFPPKGVTWNLNWTAIHDPLRLTRTISPAAPESTEKDYLGRQLKTLLHELEHVFGAGSGEYYNATAVTDTTGIAPKADLELANPTDRYWWPRQHWRLDPLLGTVFEERFDPAANRVATLEMIRFTAGTKANINTDWSDWPRLGTSKYMAATTATQVRVTDAATGAALAGALVSVWRDPGARKPLELLVQGATDANGRFAFDWHCGFSCFAVGKTNLLVKAQSPERAPGATWFTIFDAFEQKAVQGQSAFTIDLPLGVRDTDKPTVSLAAPAMATVGQPTTLAPVAIDNVGVAGVKVVGTNSLPICTFTAPPYTCTWTPTTPGTQTIHVIAIDAAGNASVASANVIVNPPADTVAPSATLAAPQDAVVGMATRLSATASDNVGVAELKFIVDGRTMCALKAAPYVCAWTPAKAGAANIELRVADAAGNIVATSANVRVDAGLRPEDM